MVHGVFIPQFWHYNLGPCFLSCSLHFCLPHQPVNNLEHIDHALLSLIAVLFRTLGMVANKYLSNC